MSYLNRARITAIALLFVPLAAPGQASQEPIPEAASEQEMEEIIVYAEVPLIVLRAQMDLAIENYFDAFNDLNSTDEFDIRCRRERATGSNLQHRICRAKFFTELEAQAAFQWRELGGPPPAAWLASRQPVIEDKRDRLYKEMAVLVEEHPTLMDALTEADEAQKRFQEERERRCEGRFLFCRR